MFKIYDGRNEFFQWDLDRKLIVSDPAVDEVHFCNKTDDCSLVCEVYEQDGLRLVNVPNILLQDNWAIRVYAYCGNCYTKQSATYKVNARSKPADYVYTETEIKKWDAIVARMDVIENTITDENIERVVNEYLDEHPVEAGATAEQAAQIAQNAADIKALQEAEPDLSNYYTKGEVNTIAKDFALKSDIPSVDEFITEIPSEYVTESELTAKNYAKKSEIPSLNGYATETYVKNAVNAIPKPDLSNYYTKNEILEMNDEVINSIGLYVDRLTSPGTPVPNDGSYIDMVYFNVTKTAEQVVDIIENANLPFLEGLFEVPIYPIAVVNNKAFCVLKFETDYVIAVQNIMDGSYELVFQTVDSYGWRTGILTFGGATLAEFEGVQIGTHNDKLVNLISTTPNFGDVKVDLSDYALKSELPSVEGLATEKYVDDAVATIDLTDYALKSDIPSVDEFITEIPAEYVTESELTAKNYATKSELPSVEGLATETYVDTKIADIPTGEAVFISNPRTPAEFTEDVIKALRNIVVAFEETGVPSAKSIYIYDEANYYKPVENVICKIIDNTYRVSLGILIDGKMRTFCYNFTIEDKAFLPNGYLGGFNVSCYPTYSQHSTLQTKVDTLEGNMADYALKTDVPTEVSKLTNDAGYITEGAVDLKITNVNGGATYVIQDYNNLTAEDEAFLRGYLAYYKEHNTLMNVQLYFYDSLFSNATAKNYLKTEGVFFDSNYIDSITYLCFCKSRQDYLTIKFNFQENGLIVANSWNMNLMSRSAVIQEFYTKTQVNTLLDDRLGVIENGTY